jgi:hypothetical protein
MTTHIAIDHQLLEEARVLGQHATKKAAVNEALAEYVQRRKQAEIIGLFNTLDYEPGFDYKSLRKKR